jgi:folate-dependent phosphoribosylglycinamide formyltransferase PurN
MVSVGSRIKTVIINEGDQSRIRYNLRKAPAYLIIAGSRKLSTRLLGSHPYLQRVSLSDIEVFKDAKRVHCKPVPRSDLGQELPELVVSEYCSDLDFLVRFGFGIIRGEVLDAPKYGVFSYHHGDLREYRGRPAGFWEFMHDSDTIGVTLQQLTDELDGGGVIQIKEFEIGESDTYQDVLSTAYLGGVDMLSEAVSSIHSNDFSPTKPDRMGELNTAPDWRSAIRYVWKNSRQRITR